MAGYGAYWAIIEDLYQNANALHPHYERIAYELRISTEMAESIINDFNLFVYNNDGSFGSNSVSRRMQERIDKSTKARESASYRWNKMRTHNNNDANALQSECNSNAIKERKVKEKKIKEINKELNSEIEFEEAIIANHELIDWINANCKRVAKMKRPLTNDAADKLCEEFGFDIVKQVILDMENWEPLHKKSIDTNLTCRNWLNRRNNAKPTNTTTYTANTGSNSRTEGIKDWVERQRNNPFLFGQQDPNL